jgi:O-phosphoseryl-tRNA(Cys) synthetase
VVHGAGKNIGDRLDAPVRMPGKAGEVVGRNIVPEIVEQEERIEISGVAESEGAA